MSENELRENSLVLYKNRAARITEMGRKKIYIHCGDGETLKVRHKDVTLLHPGPLERLSDLGAPEGEIKTAWELLAGSTTYLAELAELAYGEFTPQTAWATWRVVDDGLYFEGEPDEIIAHTPQEVEEERQARAEKAAEAAAWKAFLERVKAGRHEPEDSRFLAEVVNLALGQQEKSRVLRALNQEESPEQAHQLLLRIGYWDHTVNPYPARSGLPTEPPQIALPALPEEERRDLTHLPAFAIDDAGSRDPDDAVSWENGRLWVHVADVAALAPPDSEVDLEARARGATLYLPEGAATMLPEAATAVLGLGLQERSPALSFGVDLDAGGEIRDLEVVPSWVKVTRLSYAEADERLGEEPLRSLYRAAETFQKRRGEGGAIEIDLPEVKVRVNEAGEVEIRPLPRRRSRDLVREAMLMAGEAVGRFAIARQIPLPFTAQDGPSEPLPPADTISQMFARRRLMQPSHASGQPGAHAGLGLEVYVQATSPLRRYLDLVVHQQLRAYVRGEEMMEETAVMARVGAAEAVRGDTRWVERQSNLHWKLVYLQQHPDWRGEGIVVESRGKRYLVLIPALDMDTRLHRSQLSLDESVILEATGVDLPTQSAHFRLIE